MELLLVQAESYETSLKGIHTIKLTAGYAICRDQAGIKPRAVIGVGGSIGSGGSASGK